MIPLKDENPTKHRTWVTLVFIVANVAIFALLQQQQPETDVVTTPAGDVAVQGDLSFNLEHAAVPCELTTGEPLSLAEIEQTFARGDDTACNIAGDTSPELFPDKNVWLAVVFSMFLHGSWLHLGSNMLFLWIFGNNIEDHLGAVRYIAFYLVGGLAAAVAHVAVQPESTIPVVGASGAIAAVMGAYLVWFPEAPVRTLVFIVFLITFVRVRAKWLLAFWFVLQFFTSPDAGVAWVAHVGGFVFGVAIGLLVRATRTGRTVVWTSDYRQVGGHWDPSGGVDPRPWYRDDDRRFGGRDWR